MGRPLRPDAPGTWHHIVNRGAARQPVFLTDRDRVEFHRLLGVAHKRFGIIVHAYCLMGNHYHLLIECPDGHLSDAMHLIGSVYVRHFNERAGRDGPLFRDRFRDRRVDSDTYLRRLVTYIHQNPLAFLAPERLTSYRWSSLRVYTGDRRVPTWMGTESVGRLFGSRAEVVASAVGGPDTADRPLPEQWWSDVIDLAVDEFIAEGARQSASKTVTVLLAEDPAFSSLVSFPSTDAARMAKRRAERRLLEQPELRAAVDAAARLIA